MQVEEEKRERNRAGDMWFTPAKDLTQLKSVRDAYLRTFLKNIGDKNIKRKTCVCGYGMFLTGSGWTEKTAGQVIINQ